MALNFPSSPQVGDVYNFGSTSYRWDGNSWVTGTSVQTSGYTGSMGYTGSSTGAVGGAGNPVFFENDATVTANYTITTNKNAMSAGPITVNNGVTVTVPNGSVWSIV